MPKSNKEQSTLICPINEKFHSIILDSVADGIFTVDLDFRITEMNRSAEEILGLKKGEAVGKLCFEVFHANICEHSCALKETIKSGINISNKTIYVVNSAGAKIPISVNTALLKDQEGAILGGVESFRDISALETLRKEIESKFTYEDIVSKNKAMREIMSLLPDIAESNSSVLIEGGSGTGKELIARAVHSLSGRKEKSFVAINCAAIPDTLLESELFGYKAGAFTDAKKDKPGKIAVAEGGTIFLDEIGEVSPVFQVKLLRFLQEKEYDVLGSTKSLKADVRIVCATNKILSEEVGKGNFRDDLFYRINVVNIKLPPLSERREDIPLLVGHFIKKYNAIKNKNIEGVTDRVMNILMEHDYRGNIRELENIIEYSFVLCREPYIRQSHLPKHLKSEDQMSDDNVTLEEMEKFYIERALSKNEGNKKKAASDLGIDASTLWRKIKKYGI